MGGALSFAMRRILIPSFSIIESCKLVNLVGGSAGVDELNELNELSIVKPITGFNISNHGWSVEI